MANENLSTDYAPSFDTVRNRETSQSGELISKRGKYIDIGGHIAYPYETSAVMGNRGHDEPSHSHKPGLISISTARPMSGREVRISETPKKATFGNTDTMGNIG